MAKEKFIYNKQTLRYEKVVEPLKAKIFRVFGFLCAVLVTAMLFFALAYEYFPSPKEKSLQRALSSVEKEYLKLNDELARVNLVVDNLRERDAYAHRMIFGMDPIDDAVWEGGIGGHEPNVDPNVKKYTGNLLSSSQQRLEKIKRKMALQSKSLDTIISLAEDREKMLASIPSIKPVRVDKLKRNIDLLSGFGRRIDPFTKVARMHKGIDFTAPTGTPIYAAGDGKIRSVAYKRTGYGYHVRIDHGYGYETLYAHMSKIVVKPGEKVKKGQIIGHVGSTGRSTAPHCHYEVRINGNAVDPLYYCLDKLTPEEYQVLVKTASALNQSFD